jgi:hypothetical protein
VDTERNKTHDSSANSGRAPAVASSLIILLLTTALIMHCCMLLLQVSKTAPTGEYLPTGSFMIRGKKNFLPPQVEI